MGGELWSLKELRRSGSPVWGYSSTPGSPSELLVARNEKLEAQDFPRLMPGNCFGR